MTTKTPPPFDSHPFPWSSELEDKTLWYLVESDPLDAADRLPSGRLVNIKGTPVIGSICRDDLK